MLITFSGLDGSGKSTLVDYLKESLEDDNQRVAVSHMYYDIGVYACLRFLVQQTVGRIGGRSEKRTLQTHAPREQCHKGKFRSRIARLRYQLAWNKSLRIVVYPLDVLIFLLYRFYVEKLHRQILIMDRYFYDTLVDVTGARSSFRLRFLSWLTPTPSLPVYLDISPENAFLRKSEYSVAYLSGRRLSYQKLISELPKVLVLSTEQDLEITRRSLTSAIRERMVTL
jgi:thymidylate kinase